MKRITEEQSDELLKYELAGLWWLGLIRSEWFHSKLHRFLARRVRRKYKSYLILKRIEFTETVHEALIKAHEARQQP